MRSFLYGVSPADPLIFGRVIAILVLIARIASYLPTQRATHIEPTKAPQAE